MLFCCFKMSTIEFVHPMYASWQMQQIMADTKLGNCIIECNKMTTTSDGKDVVPTQFLERAFLAANESSIIALQTCVLAWQTENLLLAHFALCMMLQRASLSINFACNDIHKKIARIMQECASFGVEQIVIAKHAEELANVMRDPKYIADAKKIIATTFANFNENLGKLGGDLTALSDG